MLCLPLLVCFVPEAVLKLGLARILFSAQTSSHDPPEFMGLLNGNLPRAG